MSSLSIFVIGLMCGILFPYCLQILDLFMQHLVNKQTVAVSKMNKEITENSKDGEVPELQPAIGFHVEPQQEEIYEDEDE